MATLASGSFYTPAMHHSSPQAHSSGSQQRHRDADRGPSQPSTSQRFLSQVLPLNAPLASTSSQLHQSSICNSSVAAASSTLTSLPSQRTATSTTTTSPTTSTSRLSHPPPPPPISSHSKHATPQSKRARLHHDFGGSPTSFTSNLPTNAPASLTSPSTDPSCSTSTSTSTVRPLSGITRPLPMPPTPTPSRRQTHAFNPGLVLQPMPQRTVEDLNKLIPHRQPAPPAARLHLGPQRALLQAIPPQPPAQLPADSQADDRDLRLPPATEILQPRPESLLTGFRSLDLDLDRIAEVASLEHADIPSAEEPALNAARGSARSDSAPWLRTSRGLPSGSIVEVLGPPGSGKSSFVVQAAVTERLRSLSRARKELELHDETDEPRSPGDVPSEPLSESGADACAALFTDDFWDAEVASADQVLLIDCEGALTPEKIADAVWSTVISLWSSKRRQRPQNNSGNEAGTAPAGSQGEAKEQRAEMPEVVRRLVAAVLAGIHLNRVTSTASLLALLISLRPTDELQDSQARDALPSAMPARTSLILIDSLSYHLRMAGASSQDRKISHQLSERVRDMLHRLQKPFEHRPSLDLGLEGRDTARQHAFQAAARLCVPTIVFTNQLGVRRERSELDSPGRASPSGRSVGSPGPRTFRKNGPWEGTSMLAPMLNGQRPPQPAAIRDERPAPSVALGGPEMDGDGEARSLPLPRLSQQGRGRANGPTASAHGHDRGWNPSFMGQDVWRLLLFRHGTAGRRFAQIVSIPPAVQSELSDLWTQTRARVSVRAEGGGNASRPYSEDHGTTAQVEATSSEVQDAATGRLEEEASEKKDQRILELLAHLRASLFRWRPFHVTSAGLVS